MLSIATFSSRTKVPGSQKCLKRVNDADIYFQKKDNITANPKLLCGDGLADELSYQLFLRDFHDN